MDKNDYFSQLVKSLRERGFSDAHLAELCGCKRQTIYYIRTGKTEMPRYDVARQLEKLSESINAAP